MGSFPPPLHLASKQRDKRSFVRDGDPCVWGWRLEAGERNCRQLLGRQVFVVHLSVGSGDSRAKVNR